jgi:hypothetical protein
LGSALIKAPSRTRHLPGISCRRLQASGIRGPRAALPSDEGAARLLHSAKASLAQGFAVPPMQVENECSSRAGVGECDAGNVAAGLVGIFTPALLGRTPLFPAPTSRIAEQRHTLALGCPLNRQCDSRFDQRRPPITAASSLGRNAPGRAFGGNAQGDGRYRTSNFCANLNVPRDKSGGRDRRLPPHGVRDKTGSTLPSDRVFLPAKNQCD